MPRQSDMEAVEQNYHYCSRCKLVVHDISVHCDICDECVLGVCFFVNFL